MAATLAELTALQSTTLAAITALTTGGASSYTINGRSVTKNNLAELQGLYDWLTTKIAEVNAASRRNPSASVVRFNKPN